MGKIHQMGDEYYIEFTARGLIYQQKAGKDLLKAQELLQSIEEKISRGETMTLARQIDLDIFFAEFLKHARTQYHPSTVRRLKSTADHFLGFIQTQRQDVKQLSQITPRVIEDYKAYGIQMRQAKENPLNPKIINLTIILLREILDYGIKTGFINDNPTLHVSFLESKRVFRNILSDEQCTRIMEQIPAPYQDLFRFLRFTGLRPKELVTLTWQQVDLNRQVILVRVREVPLMMPAIKILQTLSAGVIDHKALVFFHPDKKAIDVRQIEELFAEACLKTGMTADVSVKQLRHVFIKKLLEKRVPLLSIGKISGIPDVAKLMRFAHHMPVNPFKSGC